LSRSARHAGPYALGTFHADREFAGLVVGSRVHPIDEIAGLRVPSVRDLLEHWDAVRPEMAAMADRDSPDAGLNLDSLSVLPPVQPRQIFQSGANYRTHVMDLAVADRKPGDDRSDEEVRAEIGRLQDERAANGEPYVFTGVVSAMCGAYDDVVLPTGTSKNDFELELAAVWQGHERGVVTRDEVHQRLEELERLLWRRVMGRLRKVTPEASVYVGFAVSEQPAQELA